MVDMVALKPCPFCGGGETTVNENRLNRMPDMGGRQSPIISVEIRHWCQAEPGQPNRNIILRVGRDHASAIAAWNRRVSEPEL
jgi:hypothetical protein